MTPEEVRQHASEYCREWPENQMNYCYKPAEFILWGKLFPAEALGPRCYDHALQYTDLDRYTVEQSAVFDLRPFLEI